MENTLITSNFEKPKNWAWIYYPSLMIAILLILISTYCFIDFAIFSDYSIRYRIKFIVLLVFCIMFFKYVKKLNHAVQAGTISKQLYSLEFAAYLLVFMPFYMWIDEVKTKMYIMLDFDMTITDFNLNEWTFFFIYLGLTILFGFFVYHLVKTRLILSNFSLSTFLQKHFGKI